MQKVKDWITTGIIVFIVLSFFWVVGREIYLACSKEEISREHHTYVITKMVYAEEQINRDETEPVYKMGIKRSQDAQTITIAPEDYAYYSVGDTVEIEIVTYEKANGEISKNYNIKG